MRPTSRPPSRRIRRSRAGFTIIELLLAMTMLLAVMGAGLSLYQRQSTTMAQQSRRLDALSNAYYATGAIERELRIAGVGLSPGQPVLVAATRMSVVFNTNLVATTDTADAVYVNADADPATIDAWPQSRRLPVPGHPSDLYPDTTHRYDGATISRAETIAFWFSRDSTAPDPTEHVLFRRVNDARPEVVAKGILIAATDTVFEYFRADTLGRLTSISPASLPLSHAAAMHGSDQDVGAFATVDSIRMVRIRLRAVTRTARMAPSVRRAETVVRILNAGLESAATCGQSPLPVSAAASIVMEGSTPTAQVTWSTSIDETSGERDVSRYVIFRRIPGSTAWDDLLTSIPAGGGPNYSYTDANVRSGQRWQYGVAAQDCSPANSPVAATASLVVP
ncbi:MAG TPA: hypothetical protein VEA99_05560 [Gemmatimonadaceae bacterium]|nr:hypothetical protein [Gemmatimonadaceae bacterium]